MAAIETLGQRLLKALRRDEDGGSESANATRARGSARNHLKHNEQMNLRPAHGTLKRQVQPSTKNSSRGLPPGFRLTAKGLFKGKKPVCSRLIVDAETRDASGEAWGRLLVVPDRDGIEHRWAMPMSMLAGDGKEYRHGLLRLGLEIEPGKPAREALHEYISKARPTSKLRCVDRIGWYGDTFVLPDATLGSQTEECFVLQRETVLDHAFFVSGTLESWQTQVASYAIGNSRIVTALSAAPAAALLAIGGIESGGIHFTGGSSIGKSTALIVAGSFWGGGGRRGRYIEQWRATDNGLEAIAEAHNDALLCLDELSQVSPQAACAAAYMLSNGAGKVRANQKGNGEPTKTWRLLFISSGELRLADKISEDPGQRQTAGQEVRIVDISADSGAGLGLFEDLKGFDSGAELSDHLRRACARYYGVASREFISKVASNTEHVRTRLNALSKDFIAINCPPDCDGQVKRVATRFAHIAAAGELANEVGIFKWPENEAMSGVGMCFRSWLKRRGGSKSFEEIEGIRSVASFLQANGTARFEPWTETDREGAKQDRLGWRRRDDETQQWDYFATAHGWKELTRGFDGEKIAKAMKQKGLLMAGKDKASKTLTPPGYTKMRLYHIAANALSTELECGHENDEFSAGISEHL